MASKWVDQFLRTAPKSFTQDEVRKSKFGEYFEHLQQNLDRLDENNLLLGIANEILSLDAESDDLELLLSQILLLIPDFQFEFRRLILKSEGDGEIDFYGADNSTIELDYLDPQVITLLEKNERIFIRDTSKIHTLKFHPNKIIPKSFLGLSLETIIGWKCFLWFANSKEVVLTKDQVDGLELIKAAIGISISKILRNISQKNDLHVWKSAFNEIPYPCFILIKNRIGAKNSEAEKITKLGEQQENEKLSENFVSAIAQKMTHIEINDQSFRLYSSSLGGVDENKKTLLLLVNENEITIQRDYLNNVMQGIALNIETPLNNILGYSGMIPLLVDLDRSQQEYLDRINQEAKSCLTFSNDLLELARFNGDNPFLLREITSGEITSNLLEVSQHLLRQKRISVEDKIEHPELLVNVDSTLLGQALYLILEFMLDKLEPGKKISIFTLTEENEFIYQLTDDGTGISDIDVALLNSQKPDSGVDPRIRAAGGIMKLFGGRFTIQSELGKGSEYRFSWPLK